MHPQHEHSSDIPIVRQLIALVRETLMATPPAEALTALQPTFAGVLADPTWLPGRYRQSAATPAGSGAGSTELLYRATTGDLSLAVLTLAPKAAMLIQDQYAWGLLGLYQGEQDVEVYRRRPGPSSVSGAPFEQAACLRLRSGECFALLPPSRAVYRVIATGTQPAISIHLAGWSQTWPREGFIEGAGI